MVNLRNFIEKINTGEKRLPDIRYDEPMFKHTTFKVGGNADVFIRPPKDIFLSYAAKLLKAAKGEGIPVFILGAGANILVSDRGIRGIVLDTGSFNGIEKSEKPSLSVTVDSGALVDDLVSSLADMGLSGLEFLAGLPASVGGAVWMNARCYEKSVSDVLVETEILNENFEREIIPFNGEHFAYKKSPFQNREVLILKARFAVESGEPREMLKEMTRYRRDRDEKGHYRFPSAGCFFKNDRAFNDPTGKIIDKLKLCGLSIGGARVAPWHGNIIVNTGNAAAKDIRLLAEEVAKRVKEEHGFELQSEILFAGDW